MRQSMFLTAPLALTLWTTQGIATLVPGSQAPLRPGNTEVLEESHTGPIFPVKVLSPYSVVDTALYANEDANSTDLLFQLHKDLVSAESTTYAEAPAGKVIAEALLSLGFTVEEQFLDADSEERFNVYAYYGSERDVDIVVTSHIDTVPPYSPYNRDSNGTISGRGSVDAKGSVAAQVAAVVSLQREKLVAPQGQVGLLFVVGEEGPGDGMQAANHLFSPSKPPKKFIFGEPTGLALACGHKGILSFEVQATGKAAHSGYPWLGVSANEVLLDALTRVRALQLPKTKKYGKTTLNIGRLDGGVAPNVVPEHAVAQVTLRLAGGSAEKVRKRVENVVLNQASKGEDLKVVWKGSGYDVVDIDCNVKGFRKITVNYGTDIPNLNVPKTKQERYLFGPGSILVAHGDHEAISEEELAAAVRGYRKLIRAP